MNFLRRTRFMRISIFLVANFVQKILTKLHPTLRRSKIQAVLRALAVTSLLAFYQNCGGNMNPNCNSEGPCDKAEFSSQSGSKSHSSSVGTSSGARGGSVLTGGSTNGDGRGGSTPGWSSGGSTTGRGGSVTAGGSGSSSGGQSGGISGGLTGGTSSGTTTAGASGGSMGGATGGVIGGTSSGTTGGVNSGTSGGTTTGTTGAALPLRISTQPISQDIYEYAPVKLTVAVEGGRAPYNYSWTLNGLTFTGSYISNAPEIGFNVGGYLNLKNQGDFKVTITDSSGNSAISSVAVVRIKEAELNCAAQDYYHLTENRQDLLSSLMVPDSPTAENIVPLRNFFVTPIGTKYLLPLNLNPFYAPIGTNNSINPIGMFLNNSYIQKSGWRMPASSHGGQISVACTPAVNGVSSSNWLKDFNEFPDNPNPISSWHSGGDGGGSGGCQFFGNSQECARINTTYALRGNLVFECRNNKYKYISGSCYWEALPSNTEPNGGRN